MTTERAAVREAARRLSVKESADGDLEASCSGLRRPTRTCSYNARRIIALAVVLLASALGACSRWRSSTRGWPPSSAW